MTEQNELGSKLLEIIMSLNEKLIAENKDLKTRLEALQSSNSL